MDNGSAPWVVDFHCDTLSEIMRTGDTLVRRTGGHLDASRLAAAGVNLQVFALFSRPEAKCNLHEALVMIDLFWRNVNEGVIAPVLWREDLDGAPGAVPAGMLSLEGGEPLGGDPRLVSVFFRLGVRAIGLTWNGRNALADGVREAASRGGLTTAGRQVVAEMNRLGMLVDVSHLSEAGFDDVVQVCAGPFIASHSNCRALCDHPRNLTDEQLRAIAAAGGVVGLNFMPGFLRKDGPATSADILRHAEHMLAVMGRGHVGLGSDYDGIDDTPSDMPDVAALPRLAELFAKHFGAEVAAEIMGGSFAALLRRVLPKRSEQTTAASG